MPNKFEQKIISYIRSEGFGIENSSAIVALSGGADSVALLHIFKRILCGIFNVRLSAAHLNHSLRGKESDRDEKFVKQLCKNLGIALICTKCRIIPQKGESMEEAARRIRYDFLLKAAATQNSRYIATAHHRDDQAETVLFRLMSGSGPNGLASIAPVNLPYIRPLLSVSRKEIEEYLINKKIDWRTDNSNFDVSISRNRIRHRLIPFMIKEFGEHIPDTIARFADNCRSTPNAVSDAKKLIDQLLQPHTGKVALSRKQLSELIELTTQNKQSVRRMVPLGEGIFAFKAINGILLQKENPQEKKINSKRMSVTIDLKEGVHDTGNFGIVALKQLPANIQDIKLPDAKAKTAYFDAAKVGKLITIRNRKSGDFFTPLGSKGRKKISDLLIDEKVPQAKRDLLPIVTFGEEIAWVVGVRISEKFKITEKTENIVIIRFTN